MDYQKFSLVRDNSMSYGGTYYIKYGSQYITANASTGDVELSSYNGLNAMWSLEKVDKGDADLFYFSEFWYAAIPVSTIKNKLTEMGYNTFAFEDYTSSSPLTYMKNDDIWIHTGHGSPSRMCFTEGTDIQCTDIKSMSYNELNDMRCMITVGCQSGSSNENQNLIDDIYNKGAKFAVGFVNDMTSIIAESWISKFMQSAEEGKTVKECMDDADIYAGIPFVGTGTKYYRGDTYQRLDR